MQPDGFRKIALNLPEASEGAHMGHADFRVAGKIFATLGYPDDRHGMVVLPLDEQAKLIQEMPTAFAPAAGAWGRRGSTIVNLEVVKPAVLHGAIVMAWRKRAPKRLHNSYDL